MAITRRVLRSGRFASSGAAVTILLALMLIVLDGIIARSFDRDPIVVAIRWLWTAGRIPASVYEMAGVAIAVFCALGVFALKMFMEATGEEMADEKRPPKPSKLARGLATVKGIGCQPGDAA